MFRRPAEFRFPESTATLYPSNHGGPWQLEVGFGDGRFWAAHRLAEEGANYLGVELSGVSVLKARSRLGGTPNVVLTRASAEFVVRNVVPPEGLARVYVNFPDPWPKARHAEARLLRPDFLELLSTRLAEGGELWLTTDSLPYLEFALESADPRLYRVSRPEPPAAALETKYARRWRGEGLAIHHARLRRLAPASRPFPPLEVFPMPHAVLRGPLAPPPFEKRVARGPDHTVILLEGLAGPGRLVVLARVEEPDLAQEVLVSASARGDEVVVGLEAFGGPLVTSGVKAAVGEVAGWLAEHGLELVRRSY